MENLTSYYINQRISFSGIISKMKLTPTAGLVLRALADCYNNKTGKMFPSYKKLSEYTGRGEKNIYKAIIELEKAGLIITSKTIGRNSLYLFTAKLLKLILPENNEEINSCQNDGLTHVKMTVNSCQNDILTNKKQINKTEKEFFKKNGLTEFQKKYADVFPKLSEYDFKKYESLPGYEKENWLKNKRKEQHNAQKAQESKQEYEKSKQTAVSFHDYVDSLDYSAACDFIERTEKVTRNSEYVQFLRKKYNIWGQQDEIKQKRG